MNRPPFPQAASALSGSSLEIPPAEVRTALDGILLSSVQSASLGLGSLYVVLAAIKPFALANAHPAFSNAVGLLTGLEVVMAITFLLQHLWLRRGSVPTRLAHPLAAGIVGFILLDAILHMVLLPKPLETISFILLSLGVALFAFAPRWFIGLQAAVVGGWGLGVALSPPPALEAKGPPWMDLGLFLLEAMVVAAVVFVSRLRTHRRLEALRIQGDRLIRELETANQELEAFSYSVSHDLRGPLRGIDGFSLAIVEDYGHLLPEEGLDWLSRVRSSTQKLGNLINDLLRLSRVTRAEMVIEQIDLSELSRTILNELAEADPGRKVEVRVAEGLSVRGDRRLLRLAMENLLDNAWKYSRPNPDARIELGTAQIDGESFFFVRDNGAGFDMAYVNKLFHPFARLHTEEEFSGTGIGLATVHRIIRRHGGKIRGEGRVGEGATFYFIC